MAVVLVHSLAPVLARALLRILPEVQGGVTRMDRGRWIGGEVARGGTGRGARAVARAG